MALLGVTRVTQDHTGLEFGAAVYVTLTRGIGPNSIG